MEDLNLEKCFQVRLVKLSFQPFEKIGLHIYVLGSLSSCATYSNDADFCDWGEKSNSNATNNNNCFIFTSFPLDPDTVEGVLKWVESVPVWIETCRRIKFAEEFLTTYY